MRTSGAGLHGRCLDDLNVGRLDGQRTPAPGICQTIVTYVFFAYEVMRI